MVKLISRIIAISLLLSNAAYPVGLAIGGGYVFGYPIGTSLKTEETIGEDTRTFDLDSGIEMGYGTTNFGLGVVFLPSDYVTFGFEGAAEYHMTYRNKACSITGTTEYLGEESEYNETMEADELEQEIILLNAGARYTAPFLGMFRPFIGGGFAYAINKLHELDEEGARSGVFDSGNNPGIYGMVGLELSMSRNYSIFIPIKYTYFWAGTYDMQISDGGSGGGLAPATEYKLQTTPILTVGIGIYYIPFWEL
jgi:opacity protein-like surface antigen